MINETAKWNNRISIMFSLLLVITLNLYAVGVETLQWANSVGEAMGDDDNESSRYWKNHGIENISVRTGIHTGSVIAGNIGSEKMLQYSTIGDVVNVAARLEQANKDFDTNICISEEIYINLTKKLHDAASFSGEIKLKGRNSSSKVYGI